MARNQFMIDCFLAAVFFGSCIAIYVMLMAN